MTIISHTDSKSLKKIIFFEFNNPHLKNKIKNRKSFNIFAIFIIGFIFFMISYVYIVNLQTAFLINIRENSKKVTLLEERNNVLEAKVADLLSMENFKKIAQKYNLKVEPKPMYLETILAIR